MTEGERGKRRQSKREPNRRIENSLPSTLFARRLFRFPSSPPVRKACNLGPAQGDSEKREASPLRSKNAPTDQVEKYDRRQRHKELERRQGERGDGSPEDLERRLRRAAPGAVSVRAAEGVEARAGEVRRSELLLPRRRHTDCFCNKLFSIDADEERKKKTPRVRERERERERAEQALSSFLLLCFLTLSTFASLLSVPTFVSLFSLSLSLSLSLPPSPERSEPARERWEAARAKVTIIDLLSRTRREGRAQEKQGARRKNPHRQKKPMPSPSKKNKSFPAAPPPPAGPNAIRGVGAAPEPRTPSVPRVKLVLLGDSVRACEKRR